MLEEFTKTLRGILTPTTIANLPESSVALASDFVFKETESLQSNRNRERYCFTTTAPEGFIGYVNHSVARLPVMPLVTVDPENMKAQAIINAVENGKPGQADHAATLTLQETDEHQQLARLIANPTMTQREMIDWIYEWGHMIETISRREFEAGVRGLTVDTAKMKTSGIQQSEEELSESERIAIKSAATLPGTIDLTLNMYHHMPLMTITCVVESRIISESPAVVLRPTAYTVTVNDCAEWLVDEISKGLVVEDSPVHLGRITRQN